MNASEFVFRRKSIGHQALPTKSESRSVSAGERYWWRSTWKRIIARFRHVSRDQVLQPKALKARELWLLARVFGKELANMGRRAAEKHSKRLLVQHKARGHGRINFFTCEQCLRSVATRMYDVEAAQVALDVAAVHETDGDFVEAHIAYTRALELGPRQPVAARLRFARFLRAACGGGGSGKSIGACEEQLRLAIGSALSSPVRVPTSMQRGAIAQLALLLYQEGREPEVQSLLRQGGWKYRLAPCVMRYQRDIHVGGNLSKDPLHAAAGVDDYILDVPFRAFDGALSPGILQHLQKVFSSESKFWREHGYNEFAGCGEDGYFSYVHGLSGPLQSSLDIMIRSIYTLALPHYPVLVEAKAAEWWAHCRPHACGHQLHFDSGDAHDSLARHPICTAVVFVSAPSGVGGPTLVTDQRLGDRELAKRGWLVFPRTGRVALCDGSVLHGVIPGIGEPPSDAPLCARRITWMVAFWRESAVQPFSADGCAGVCRPLPDPERPFASGPRNYTWHQQLKLPVTGLSDCMEASSPVHSRCLVAVPMLPQVWVPVDDERIEGSAMESKIPAYKECFQVGYAYDRSEWD